MKKFIFSGLSMIISAMSAYGQSGVGSIIPKPLSVQQKQGSFLFTPHTTIIADVSEKDQKVVRFLTAYLKNERGFPNVVKPLSVNSPKQQQVLITDKGTDKLAPEAYEMVVAPKSVTVRGRGAGLFYGIQSLIQLFPNQRSEILALPCVQLKDEPRFGYRGLMLDVSRHFFTVSEVKDLLDLMAAYKLNRFHWHLTDDQGWRIEIKSFPKLTSVGAWRVPRKDFGMEAPRPGEKATDGGFYSQEQIREVVRYAAERHIQVMPEIDVPGHSMAAIASYPELSVTKNMDAQVNPGSSFARWFPTGGFEMFVDNTLNPTDENVYSFLDKVFGEVAGLFPYEYIHIGGDECYKGFWEKNQGVKEFMQRMNIPNTHALQSYFTERVSRIIRSKNKKAIGWDEIFDKDKQQEVAIMNRFGEAGAIAQSKKNLDIIMAPGNNGLYFDYAQSYSDMEPSSHGQFSPLWMAYNYRVAYPKMDAGDKQHMIGVEACIWTESIPSVAKLQYMLLPRMLALAETGWSSLENKDYERFVAQALPIHLQRFDQKGLNYRVPTVFNYTDSILIGKEFNIALQAQVPGSRIFYTLNNRFPTDADHLYTSPIQLTLADNKKYILKTIVVTPSGRRSVVTRTVLYNPLQRKSAVGKAFEPGLSYQLIDFGTGKIDTGIAAVQVRIGSAKNCLLKMQGYLYIPQDGYYEFTANPKNVGVSVAGAKVITDPKPDRPDPLHLQKGYHPILIEQNQNVGEPFKLFYHQLNQKPVEILAKDLFH